MLTTDNSWCILFATFGMTNAFGVYQDYYVRIFLKNYSPSTIGWIGSVQLFFQFSMGIISGKLFDAGFFYPMMIGASILYVVSYYMLSLTHEGQFYQVFLAQGIGAGIALGFLFLPAIGIIAHHFRRCRSFAMGIVVSGGSCGGLVFPVMLNKIIERSGFAAATRAVSYLGTDLNDALCYLVHAEKAASKVEDAYCSRCDASSSSQLCRYDLRLEIYVCDRRVSTFP
jgi:MFS transporter, MCT family, solute carrier family 16 (monocarboxylic acid transporters), member 10